MEHSPDVSIIMPIFNGEKWIEPCFKSILNQTAVGVLEMELCICNDASTDKTAEIINFWVDKFKEKEISLNVFTNEKNSNGVGYAKNRAIDISKGEYLCFQDVDDVMLPDRILKQFNEAKSLENNTILGCKFRREPENSSVRYTKWANNLPQNKLEVQIYTSNGPTIIMPTWFCHKSIYTKLGGFSEKGKGEPEDLIFFYKHLDSGGKLMRVDDVLLAYSYHENGATFSVHENTIWDLRVERLQNKLLKDWKHFTIWNAGKQGKKLYNSLTQENKDKLLAFCDVDVNKLKRKKYIPYDAKTRKTGKEVDIIHFSKAIPPIVICVKLDMTDGVFEKNLESLNLLEGTDYVLFS